MISIARNLFLICLTIGAVSCDAGASTTDNCTKWLTGAIKQQESVTPDKRFSVSLEQLANVCTGVFPQPLQQAIVQSKNVKADAQLIHLQKAVKTYFPETCSDTGATVAAKYLPHVCLGEDLNTGTYSSILENVASAAYLFGKVVEQELLKSELDKHRVKRFMLNYFLGAAHSFEQRQAR